MTARRIKLLTMLMVSALCIALAGHAQQDAPARSVRRSASSSQAKSPAKGQAKSHTNSSAVDPDGCRACHAAEVDGYALSAMSHSMRAGGQEPAGEVKAAGSTIVATSSTAGSEQRLERDGAADAFRVDYVVGSGNHASGYLVDLSNHLFQSPIAYYKSQHAYGLAPGYENQSDPDFTRPVTAGCLFCHAGASDHVAGTQNEYASPPFSHLAIGCSRCHGSAESHLHDPQPGTIVNPAKLQGAARDSICEQCHLMGVARVLNPGKQFSDFKPGAPLESTFTVYRNTLPPGETAKFKVISHAEQLALSKCARNSGGRLWCGTCHDPHADPVQPAAYYRTKCLTCHNAAFSAPHPSAASNCIGCHMPRRDAKDGGHTAFTDHRIQSRPEPEDATLQEAGISAWREPSDDLRERNLGIASIEVGIERQLPALLVGGYRMLTDVQKPFAEDAEIFTAMGGALLLGKQYSEAQAAYARALELEPNSAQKETDMGQAYASAGQLDLAVRHLEDAMAKDALNLPAAALLLNIYQQQGETAKAAALASRIHEAMQSAPASSFRQAAAPGARPAH